MSQTALQIPRLKHGERLPVWESWDHKYTIALESAVACETECKPLITEHWMEIANYKDKYPLEPDWPAIRRLEADGNVILLVLREAGRMIGYSMFITRKHLHYNMIVADNDILFLEPTKRKSKLGVQLIIESERACAAAGVDKITWHMKPKKSFIDLLLRLGYVHEEQIAGKVLK